MLDVSWCECNVFVCCCYVHCDKLFLLHHNESCNCVFDVTKEIKKYFLTKNKRRKSSSFLLYVCRSQYVWGILHTHSHVRIYIVPVFFKSGWGAEILREFLGNHQLSLALPLSLLLHATFLSVCLIPVCTHDLALLSRLDFAVFY